jgi:uncharacterized protein YndB with AHSA1/START domain
LKTTTESRVLPHPVEAVFDFVADFSRTPEWDPGVLDSRRLDPWEQPVGVGSRFHVVALFGTQRVPMEYRILEHTRPTHLVLEGTSRWNRARDDIRFESLGERESRITWTLELSFLGASRLMEPFMGPLVRRLGRIALDGLADRSGMPLHTD